MPFYAWRGASLKGKIVWPAVMHTLTAHTNVGKKVLCANFQPGPVIIIEIKCFVCKEMHFQKEA
jgi:hypothetical protein